MYKLLEINKTIKVTTKMGKYRYNTFMEYLPKRYSATSQQDSDRKEIYQFKDGYCSQRIQNGIIEMIKSLDIADKSKWCVCFIPASTNSKTRRRYSELSTVIQNKTGIKSSFTAISDKYDHESGHLSGKKPNPAEDYNVDSSFIDRKHVILIDDIITRGRTFESTADKLKVNGATDIIGVFVAKTINPDWNNKPYSAGNFNYYDPADMYDVDDFDPAEFYDPSDDFDPADMYDPSDDFDPSDMY